MIVVDITLHSAIDGRTENLGTMIIDNIGGTRTKGNYNCRMFKKGDVDRVGGARSLISKAKPIRSAQVLDHPRLAEPVHTLVAKALKAMNYG